MYSSPDFSARGARPSAALVVTILLMGLCLLLGGSVLTVHGTTSGTGSSFDQVQVSIKASNSSLNEFYVSAYNSTGGLVASYESQYPVASFDIPSGSYIFTATATAQQQQGIATPIGSSAASSASATAAGTILPPIPCCGYVQSPVEYGYVVDKVTGPTSLSISTVSLNASSNSTLALRVTYPNGTAAAGAYVSATVLGDEFGWAYGTNLIMSTNSMSSQGIVTLITPAVPVLVTASASVPISLPYNQTTVQVTVAGQTVNVTAYWQPDYVYFGGQLLIMPPQTTGSIGLTYEPQLVGPIVYATGESETATAISSPPAGSAQGSAGGQQPESSGGTSGSTSTGGLSPYLLAAISIAAVAISIAALGIGVMATRSRAKAPAERPSDSTASA